MLLERSTFYYHPVKKDDDALRLRIRELAETRVRFGYKRIHVMLRHEGWQVNHKKGYRDLPRGESGCPHQASEEAGESPACAADAGGCTESTMEHGFCHGSYGEWDAFPHPDRD